MEKGVDRGVVVEMQFDEAGGRDPVREKMFRDSGISVCWGIVLEELLRDTGMFIPRSKVRRQCGGRKHRPRRS